jgi:hypothetical protein
MLEAPENYQENFEKINPSEIKIGNYILYLTKEREYKGNKYPQRWCQGYVSLIPDKEKGFERWGENYIKIFGFINRGRPWTINTDNVVEFYKSKLDPRIFREKGIQIKEKKKLIETGAIEVTSEDGKVVAARKKVAPKKKRTVQEQVQQEVEVVPEPKKKYGRKMSKVA